MSSAFLRQATILESMYVCTYRKINDLIRAKIIDKSDFERTQNFRMLGGVLRL